MKTAAKDTDIGQPATGLPAIFLTDPGVLWGAESLVRCLARRGIAVLGSPPGRRGDATAVVCGSEGGWAAARQAASVSGCPVIRITPLLPGGRLLVTEHHAADGFRADRRRARLMAREAAGIDDETVRWALTRLDGPAFATLRATLPDGAGRDEVHRSLAVDVLWSLIDPSSEAVATTVADAAAAIGALRAPTVSVIVTSHNYRAYLPQAVESALSQTAPAAEVIVVDDGSTDGSADLVRSIPGITPVLKRNGGQASAFNAGLARATGDLVLFLDADDRLLPDALARLGAARRMGASRLFWALETIDAAGQPLGLYEGGRPMPVGSLAGVLMAHGIFGFTPTSGNAFPRWVLDRIMPIPEEPFRISADLYLVLAAATLGTAVDVGGVLGQYRIHGQNGYYRDFPGALWLSARRDRQRRAAWDAVNRLLAAGERTELTDRIRLSFAGHLLKPGRPRSGLGRARALGAGVRAIAAGPIRHWPSNAAALYGAATGRAASMAPLQRDGAPTAGAALVAEGGQASWPMMRPGEAVIAEPGAPPPGVFGRGWRSGPDGMQMTGGIATLAFLVPSIVADWRLRLVCRLPGEGPLPGIKIGLNGRLIRQVTLVGSGELDAILPYDLLVGSAATGLPGIGEGRAACLRLVLPSGSRPLGVEALRLDLAGSELAPAPYVPSGAERRVDASAGRMLGDGWDWPGEDGARLAGPAAELCLSPGGAGGVAVTLGFRPRAAAGLSLAVAVQAEVNGMMVATHDRPDGESLTLVVPPRLLSRSRTAAIRLVPASGGAAGLPDLTLTSIRIDPTERDGRPALVPNVPVPAAGCARESFAGANVQGEGLRLGPGAFSVTFLASRTQGCAWLAMRFTTGPGAGGVSRGTLSVGGAARRVDWGAETDVVLRLPAEGGERIVVSGRIDPGSSLPVLQSLTVFSGGPAMGARHPATWDIAALHAAAPVPFEWHAPAEGALWLAADEATLLLPSLPRAAVALDVGVLCLDDQRLSLGFAGGPVVTSGSGRSLVRLPCAAAARDRPAALVVATDRLVAAQTLGVARPGTLGGAILSVAPVLPRRSGMEAAGAAAHEDRP